MYTVKPLIAMPTFVRMGRSTFLAMAQTPIWLAADGG